MSTAAIVFLALVSLLLLTALIAFGVGHKRWSWVSVAASFLVALTLAGYLYLAARLLHFEWQWVQVARNTLIRIDEVRDANRPSQDPENPGRLERIADAKSIAELRQERERWERALERTSNWRGRHWDKASFKPPANDGETGTLELPPPRAADDESDLPDPAADPAAAGEPAPARAASVPLDPGATVYVFDETPAEDGGLYLGAFRVEGVATDETTGRLTLTVTQTAPRDEYDRRAWSRVYDGMVTVYDTLPLDRWLAFSETVRAAPGDDVDQQIAPQPAKKSEEQLAELVPEPFRDEVERHAVSVARARGRELVDPADWQALRTAVAAGERLTGEAWAEFEFNDQVELDAFLRIERDGTPEALTAEVELGKAFELADEGKGKILKVFCRRRLIDAETLVHGAVVPGGKDAADLMTDGLTTLMQRLQQDIAALDAANERLAATQNNVAAERAVVRGQADELAADLVVWERDVAAATRLATAFEEEAARAAKRLEATERTLVELGRELDALVDGAVRAIDRVAPPPPGRGAATPAATF